MTFTITQSHEGLTRTINVAVKADGNKRLSDIDTVYDGFSLGHDFPNPQVSTYERAFTVQQGITPNQPHTIQVSARHGDGSSDSGSKTWND